MASSLPSFGGVARLALRRKFACRAFRARAQSSHGRDEGKSSTSIVDANMGALKKIIEMVRMEERYERWRRVGDGEGWNYQSEYDCKLKRRGSSLLAESLEIAELVAGTVGFTIVSCTLCLCIVSVLASDHIA